jgi:transposase-like protein
MNITLKDIIGLVKELPERHFEETFERLSEIKEKAEAEKEAELQIKCCPQCGSASVVRNGKKSGRQAYICRECKKSFVETTGCAISNSHGGETVWKQVIRDTVEGISLDNTAASLDLSHSTVFHMRHKILTCLERSVIAEPVVLSGVCELDETYVLESCKGRKIHEDYHRKPRKRGGKASKPGLSSEQICICAGVNGDGENIAYTVNRAAPSKAEISWVFSERITDDTTILCDGSKNYDTFESVCTVAHVKRPNKVNGLHSFIKERLRSMRGIATIYQNRYNALFAEIYGDLETSVSRIYELMTSRNDSFLSIADLKTKNLCNL